MLLRLYQLEIQYSLTEQVLSFILKSLFMKYNEALILIYQIKWPRPKHVGVNVSLSESDRHGETGQVGPN